MKILLTEEQIREKILDLADEIANDNTSGKLHIIFVLKGAFIFCSDLVRGLGRHQIDITIDYVLDNDGDANTNGLNQEFTSTTLGRYWSSTEYDADNAYAYSFIDGYSNYDTKDQLYGVRAIRAF